MNKLIVAIKELTKGQRKVGRPCKEAEDIVLYFLAVDKEGHPAVIATYSPLPHSIVHGLSFLCPVEGQETNGVFSVTKLYDEAVINTLSYGVNLTKPIPVAAPIFGKFSKSSHIRFRVGYHVPNGFLTPSRAGLKPYLLEDGAGFPFTL